MQPELDCLSETVAVTHVECEIETVFEFVPLGDRLDECVLVADGDTDDEVHTDTDPHGDEVELADNVGDSVPLIVGLGEDDCVSETVAE